MGLETQVGPLPVPMYLWVNPNFRILGMVVWLSKDQCQEKTKQRSKTSILRDKRSNVHYSNQCCGSTCLPSLTEASGIE